MREHYPRGSVARLFFEVIDAGEGVISETPLCTIQRRSDGKWFQASDGTWVSTAVDHGMTQYDSVNFPGLYYFDFDQSFETLASSREYIAKFINDDPAQLEYRELLFGPVVSVVAPEMCSIEGALFTAAGEPRRGALVRATILVPAQDSLGRSIESARVIMTYTDDLGEFELQLVRGLVVRVEIEAVGYDRKVTVPDLASVLLADL